MQRFEIRDGDTLRTDDWMRAVGTPEVVIEFCRELQRERERALRELGLLRSQLADRQRMAAV